MAKVVIRYLKFRNQILGLALCLFLPAGAFAAQITGTVSNGTTNKPSSGDEVVLLSLASGMNEVARTKTDSQGRYTLNVTDEGAPHLVRVARQSVHYFKQVPPGATTADITVYDAATQLDGIATDARVLHLQASEGKLDVSEMYVVKNESQPPRSRIGNQTFAIALPDGAELGEAAVTGPSGMPVSVSPVPSGVKNRYAFDFAIRPGETRFDVVYRIPYSGSYEFSLTPETRLSELGVLLPKSMKFTGTGFAQDSDEAGLAVHFLKNVAPSQAVKFSVTGEGLIQRDVQSAGRQPAADGSPASTQSGSSSGSTRDLQIQGAILFVILVGAFVLWRMIAARKAKLASGIRTAGESRSRPPGAPATAAGPGDMLDVLKDELFQLETDRMSGKITQEEYEKTKAGLDTLFRRQMKKK